jgi:hypothetical protein
MESSLERQLKLKERKLKQLESIIVVSKEEYEQTLLDNNKKNKKNETVLIRPRGDIYRVQDQNYVVISWAAPENARVAAKNVCTKISATFRTKQEAHRHAEIIRKEDDRIDVSIVSVGEWISLPLSKENEPFIRKKYTDNRLDKIMKERYLSNKSSEQKMSERMKKDREAAEKRMQQTYGPGYKMHEKPEEITTYEKEVTEKAIPAHRKKMKEESVKMGIDSYCQKASIDPTLANDLFVYLQAHEKEYEAQLEELAKGEMTVGDKTEDSAPV